MADENQNNEGLDQEIDVTPGTNTPDTGDTEPTTPPATGNEGAETPAEPAKKAEYVPEKGTGKVTDASIGKIIPFL